MKLKDYERWAGRLVAALVVAFILSSGAFAFRVNNVLVILARDVPEIRATLKENGKTLTGLETRVGIIEATTGD